MFVHGSAEVWHDCLSIFRNLLIYQRRWTVSPSENYASQTCWCLWINQLTYDWFHCFRVCHFAVIFDTFVCLHLIHQVTCAALCWYGKHQQIALCWYHFDHRLVFSQLCLNLIYTFLKFRTTIKWYVVHQSQQVGILLHVSGFGQGKLAVMVAHSWLSCSCASSRCKANMH